MPSQADISGAGQADYLLARGTLISTGMEA
jgi:hypothetical protein